MFSIATMALRLSVGRQIWMSTSGPSSSAKRDGSFYAVLTDRVSRSDNAFGFAFEFFFEAALLGGDFGLRPEPMFYCFPFGPPGFLPDLVRPLLDPVFVPPTFHVLLHNWVRPEDRGPSLAPFRGSVRLFVAEISSRALQAPAGAAIAASFMASLA